MSKSANLFLLVTMLLPALPILAAENLSASEQEARERESERVRSYGSQLLLDGFQEIDGEYSEINRDAFIKAQSQMETLRLTESGVRVLKTNRRIFQSEIDEQSELQSQLADLQMFGPGAEIASYYEIASFELDGFDHIFLRPMNPEEVLQYEREAQGLSNAEFASQLDGLADGIGALMTGLGSLGLPGISASQIGPLMGGNSLTTGPGLITACEDILRNAPNHEDALNQTIALILGPECMLRVTADRLRKLDDLTEEEIEQARETAAEAFDLILEVVSGDEDYITFGVDIPLSATVPVAAIQQSVNDLVAAFNYQFSTFPRPPLQRIGKDMLAQSLQANRPQSSYSNGNANTPGIQSGVFGQFGLGLFGNREPEPMPEPEPMSMDRYEVTFDRKTLKRVNMTMFGTMGEAGATRDVVIEQEQRNYQEVPGSVLFEPFRETSRVSGMITPEQQAEMRASMADLENQLASMPAAQRSQMEAMMGGQMAQMRSMANDGTVEITMITTSIEINPQLGQNNRGISGGSFVSDELLDTIAPGGQPTVSGGAGGGQGTGGGGQLTESGMVRMIQTSLDELGYDPGPINGQLERQTVIAITQFEAAKGMPVTGQATPQLAGILAAEVDAQR